MHHSPNRSDDRVLRLVDRLDLQDLVNRYAHCVDNFLFEDWIALFTPDGVLDETAFDKGLHVGAVGLRAYSDTIKARTQHLVHLMVNHLVEVVTDQSARGTSYALIESLSRSGERMRYQVKYEDVYRKVDGAWLLYQRVLRKTFPVEIIS